MTSKLLLMAVLMEGIFVGTSWADDPVKVSGHPDWAPFSWEADGKILGVGADLAEILFKDVGLTVSSKPSGNWKRVQLSAQNGEIDVIVAAYVTDERKAYLDYTDTPYTLDRNVIWVAKGKAFPFQKWEDLIGKTGTISIGESYGAEFDKFIDQKLKMERSPVSSSNMKKLDSGRVDYYPFSEYGGLIQAKQLGLSDKVEMLDTPISKEGVYVAVSKASKFAGLIPKLNEAIKKRIDDGTVDMLVKKNLAAAAVVKSKEQ